MSKEQCQIVKGIMSQLDGVNVREKPGASLKFRMYMTPTMKDASLEVLDLRPRAYNSLKRAGYDTIGEVVNEITNGTGLGNIRNCGKTSIREIMEHLFLYQYNSLPAGEKDDYLIEVVQMNRA